MMLYQLNYPVSELAAFFWAENMINSWHITYALGIQNTCESNKKKER